MLYGRGEIYRIKERSNFDYDNNKWSIPAFYLREKKAVFPKIKNSKDLIEQEKENRDMIIGGYNNKKRDSGNSR